jgi:hypothetical protein
MMRETLLLFLSMFYITETTIAQKSHKSIVLKENTIDYWFRNDKGSKIEIEFTSIKDSSKRVLKKKVLRDGKFNYIKLDSISYYLNADVFPSLFDTICVELQKIERDTTLRFGEPMVRSIRLEIMINKEGKVVTYGVLRPPHDYYYEDAALRILERYKNFIGIPAMINNMPVNYLLSMYYIIGSDECRPLIYERR